LNFEAFVQGHKIQVTMSKIRSSKPTVATPPPSIVSWYIRICNLCTKLHSKKPGHPRHIVSDITPDIISSFLPNSQINRQNFTHVHRQAGESVISHAFIFAKRKKKIQVITSPCEVYAVNANQSVIVENVIATRTKVENIPPTRHGWRVTQPIPPSTSQIHRSLDIQANRKRKVSSTQCV
jgi:hypothetical protein